MRKFLLSAVVVFGFGLYVLLSRGTGRPLNINPPAAIQQNSPIGSGPSRPSSAGNGQAMGMGMMRPALYRDGAYIGGVADAYYGLVQVKAVIQGGRIADVQFLQYPNDRRTSVEINSQAMPDLKAEAIQAQNAQVDVVSGATQTSRAFMESLDSALAQAK